MMRDTDTLERFQRDIAEHKMRIIREDGMYRHIRFAQPGTNCMSFELITWPGHLCYTGDMGTYVFERLHDMFEFFRRGEHNRYSIDMRYWAEKVTAGDKSSRDNGILEFSADKAKRQAWEAVAHFIEQYLTPDEDEPKEVQDTCMRARNDLRAGVREMLDTADDNDIRFYDALNDFSFCQQDSDAWKELGLESFEFSDVWEWDMRDYTFRFEWCCYALSWAMQTYDRFKERQAAICALSDETIFELKAATVELRWDEPGTETVAGYTLVELEAEMERRRMKCSCCSTTENLHRDLGSGGPYRCSSSDCVMF
jgi:hypothetical protein